MHKALNLKALPKMLKWCKQGLYSKAKFKMCCLEVKLSELLMPHSVIYVSNRAVIW